MIDDRRWSLISYVQEKRLRSGRGAMRFEAIQGILNEGAEEWAGTEKSQVERQFPGR